MGRCLQGMSDTALICRSQQHSSRSSIKAKAMALTIPRSRQGSQHTQGRAGSSRRTCPKGNLPMHPSRHKMQFILHTVRTREKVSPEI